MNWAEKRTAHQIPKEIMQCSSLRRVSGRHSIQAVTHPVAPISINTSSSTRSDAKKQTYLNITGQYHIPFGIRWRQNSKASSRQHREPWTQWSRSRQDHRYLLMKMCFI